MTDHTLHGNHEGYAMTDQIDRMSSPACQYPACMGHTVPGCQGPCKGALKADLSDGSFYKESDTDALAEMQALKAERDDCAIYLKDEETPRQRMDRDHADILSLMEMLAKDRSRREAAEVELTRWKSNARGTFDAMCAMRNSLNELLPMPSLESDLLQGPENSVFCAVVAEAVAACIDDLERQLAEARDRALEEAAVAEAAEAEVMRLRDAAALVIRWFDDYRPDLIGKRITKLRAIVWPGVML